MTMEEAIEDLARALDRLCDVIDGSDGPRLMLALDVRELMSATNPSSRHCVIGHIAGMVHALWKYDYMTEKADAAMVALHRIREIVMEEENGKNESASCD